MVIGIYNRNCYDLETAITQSEITWTDHNFVDNSDLDAHLRSMSLIINACYREDDMEYCAKNLENGKVVSLEAY